MSELPFSGLRVVALEQAVAAPFCSRQLADLGAEVIKVALKIDSGDKKAAALEPSPELIERTNGIREQWIDYWSTVTGHRSTMTAEP